MANRHYLGDDFYPAIIDSETFDKAEAEKQHRAEALGRLDRKKEKPAQIIPTNFRFEKPEKLPRSRHAGAIPIQLNWNGGDVMANVTFIPAKHKIGNNVSGDEVTKLWSSILPGQYRLRRAGNKLWCTGQPLYGIHSAKSAVDAGRDFADDGISGTNTKKRDEFNQWSTNAWPETSTWLSQNPSAGLPAILLTACST